MIGDNTAVLVQVEIESDTIGNQVEIDVRRTPLFCDVKSVTRSEFWSAGTNGVAPEITFVVHSYEYSGETRVEFGDQRYRVLRTFKKGLEETELICARGIGDG